jgi:hypothetical protein
MSLKQAIIGTIVRRVLGYLGVAGVVGLESDLAVLAGAIAAVGTVGWSIIEKIRADRS